MTQTIEVESIRRLDIKPGETLVVGLPDGATPEDAARVKDAVEARVPHGVNVIVMSAGIDLTAVADGCQSSPASPVAG